MKIGRNDPCWCGSGQKYKKCHAAFDDRLTELKNEGHIIPPHSIIKTPEQIEGYETVPKLMLLFLIMLPPTSKRVYQRKKLMNGLTARQDVSAVFPHPSTTMVFQRVYALLLMMRYVTESLTKISF